MHKFPSISNKNIVHFGYRAEPFFTSYMIGGGLTNQENLNKYFDLNHPPTHIFVNFEMFNITSNTEAFSKELSKKLLQTNKTYVNNIIKNCLRTGEHLLKISKQISQKANSKKLSISQMAILLNKYTETAYNYCGYYAIAWFEKSETELAKIIAKKYSKNKNQENNIFKLITSPSKLTTAEKEQDDFLKLAGQNPKTWEKKSEQHAKKYGHLSVRYFIGDPWTKTDVLNRLLNINRKHVVKLLKERISHRKQIDYDLKILFKQINEKDKVQIKQIRNIVFLRTQRADFYHYSSFYMQPLVKRIALHLKIEYKDLLNFSPIEIISALKGKYDVKPHIKPRRQCLVTYHQGTSIFLEGNQALKYVNKRPVLQNKIKTVNILKGSSAFPGKITGTVKIIISNKDVIKIKKGNILVSTMTTPNFIAAMEKAAAFVTNEGGILCHAAIISREMKKPCIIGTKIATKVFKDGDIIEIDANKGIIKRLK